jgi:radical SAM superfamily enzyme YgiQ (UPF0313 family)
MTRGKNMKKKILFIQLPMLDNDTSGQRENFPFAALWLSHALSQHPEGEFWEVVPPPAEWDELDNAHLIEEILKRGADAVAFSLCLWNVERAVRLALRLRELNPDLYLMAGGPEVSVDHPFLLDDFFFDALVIGEGEAVFPELLQGIRTRKMPAFDNVLIAASEGWKQGRHSPPQIDLAAVQVPVKMLKPCIEARPSVYIETSRGCPLSCTYCRYHHLQKGVRALPADAVAWRIQQLRAAGAKEIRFVDPTFNARADFNRLLELLAVMNADHQLGFFAELRADTLTPEQAELLAKAHFLDIEVGVQCTNPKVLRAIRRPANIDLVERGIQLLTDARVPVTLDLMYGLPEQTVDDVFDSIQWARELGRGISIQCMQTLLLPGTDLRAQAEEYGIQFQPLPPYGVFSTSTMSSKDMALIEAYLDNSEDLPADPVTSRFTGYRLDGLFKEKAGLNRRALLFRGRDLDSRREEICCRMAQAIQEEPDVLWQFILSPEREEPLDLFREMIAVLRRHPPHLLDRYASADLFGQMASRRIFVRYQRAGRYNPMWRGQVEDLLGRHFV